MGQTTVISKYLFVFELSVSEYSAARGNTARRDLWGKCAPPPLFGGTNIKFFKLKNYR